MRRFTQEELKPILDNHKLWLDGEGEQRANLSYSDLSCLDLSNTDLSYSDLSYSNLSNTDLSNTDLSNSDLRCSDLSNTDLSYSDLSGLDLSGSTGNIYVGQRSDGYQFFYTEFDGEWLVVAGCQKMTLAAYREHIKTYDCKFKRAETKLILDFIEKRYKLYLKKGSN